MTKLSVTPALRTGAAPDVMRENEFAGSSGAGVNEVLTIASHREGLEIRIRHKRRVAPAMPDPVLFVHGSTFPSALSFDFNMEGGSWMDQLAESNYDVYALDFLGYGLSDRYPEMQVGGNCPVGTASEACLDVVRAVDLIVNTTGAEKVIVIGHSWGGVVAALYAGKYPGKVAKLVMFAGLTVRQDSALPETPEMSYAEMTPELRIELMKRQTPDSETVQLASEVLNHWGVAWLDSDKQGWHGGKNAVRFPSGPVQDWDSLLKGTSLYEPAAIQAPTLLIRGEWDTYPNDADFIRLHDQLKNALYKHYVTVKKGTHVMHLEHARFTLYTEVLHFLQL